MLHKILSGTSFVCALVGLAGLTGTVEQAVTDPQGIVLSLGILAVSAITGLLAANENKSWKRKKRKCTYGWKNVD